MREVIAMRIERTRAIVGVRGVVRSCTLYEPPWGEEHLPHEMERERSQGTVRWILID